MQRPSACTAEWQRLGEEAPPRAAAAQRIPIGCTKARVPPAEPRCTAECAGAPGRSAQWAGTHVLPSKCMTHATDRAPASQCSERCRCNRHPGDWSAAVLHKASIPQQGDCGRFPSRAAELGAYEAPLHGRSRAIPSRSWNSRCLGKRLAAICRRKCGAGPAPAWLG